jgi:transcriptional regulator GlxA family with amidase domain
MQIDILIFEGFDELDAIAPYEILSNALDGVSLVSLEGTDPVRGSHGALIVPERALADRPDWIVVPGGGWSDRSAAGVYREVERGELTRAIAARHAAGSSIAAVCTGALLVAHAGLLQGRPAITHASAKDDLGAAGAIVTEARVVDDGDIVTCGGVTSGLDLSLHLIERLVSAEASRAVEIEIEYPRIGRVCRSPERPRSGAGAGRPGG